MLGHAFDAYGGATALIEGNVFESVDQPITDEGAAIETIYNVADASAASACSSHLGRECVVNSLASSGDWPALSSASALTALGAAADYLIAPVAATEVKAYVTANAGPANLASYTGYSSSSGSSANSTLASRTHHPKNGTETTGGSTATVSALQPSGAPGTGHWSGFQGWGARARTPSSSGWGQANGTRAASTRSRRPFRA